MTVDRIAPRALAELARAGYSSLRQHSTNVNFEVHHTPDQPGYLADLLSSTEGGEQTTFLEVITSTAYGSGLVIGTNTSTPALDSLYRNRGGMYDPPPECAARDGALVFHGSARPNLTFLYETSRRFEAIVVIDERPGLVRMYHAKPLRDLLREISSIAVDEARAPLLSVQSPVQLPVPTDAEHNPIRIPHPAGKAVRFAIALPNPSVALSFRLADRISSYCQEKGFGFYVRDTRPGCRAGNWFTVLPLPKRDHENHDEPDSRLDYLLPVTFVGPARIGSTLAVLLAICQLPMVGVAGCSITLLDDLAFIHLQLALPRSVDHRVRFDAAVGWSPTKFLQEMLAPAVQHRARITAREIADDYLTLAGPLIPLVQRNRQRKLAIWFSWQMSRTEQGLALPIATISEALAIVGLGWRDDGTTDPPIGSIDYLVCRDLGNSLVRGKGKLSVPYRWVMDTFPTSDTEPSVAQFCVAFEDAWKIAAVDSSIREITVSWREYWLGHWAAPIS